MQIRTFNKILNIVTGKLFFCKRNRIFYVQ